jgi:hypothetical protein
MAALLALAAAMELAACAAATPVALPGELGSKPTAASGTSVASGNLLVYSATYVSTLEQSEYPVHTNYTVATIGGNVIEHVTNLSGPFYAYPAKVTLPAGEYHVRAQYDRGGFVVVPVNIMSGKTTILDLSHEPLPPQAYSTREPIRLPDGRVVGWRAISNANGQ